MDSTIYKKQSESTQMTLDSLKRINPNISVGLQHLDSIKNGDPKLSAKLGNLDSLGVFIKDIEQSQQKKDSFMNADPSGYFKTLETKSGIDAFSKKGEFFGLYIKKDTLYNFEQAQTLYNIQETTTNKMAFNFSNSVWKVVSEPGTWVNETISKLPFVIFFFMPVFTVFIWLVYIRKNYTYTDHLIFSFHNQSLLFILLILSLTLDTIFDINSSGIFLLIFAFYLYKAMRKFYGQGRFKTIVKYIFLNTVFMILAFFTIIVTFAGSGLTY